MIIDIVLVWGQGRGGLENVITLISNELERRGYRVRVIQAFEPLYREWKGTIREFYCLKDSEYDSEYSIENIIRDYKEFLLKNGSPDVLIATHSPLCSFMWYESLRLCGLEKVIPILSWIHGSIWCYGENYEAFLSVADAHLAISDELYEQLREISHGKNVYLINNPVDINNELISRNENLMELVYIGRLAKEKKVDIILKALKSIDGNWTLDVYGDGSERKYLENLAFQIGISEKIVWHGWNDKPWDDIKSASVLLLASDKEGFGLVVVEALSRGVPVLSTKTDGPSKIIKDGVTGWFVDINDYNAMSTILNNIINGEIKLPNQKVCRDSVDKFDVKKIVDNFEKSILIECARKKF